MLQSRPQHNPQPCPWRAARASHTNPHSLGHDGEQMRLTYRKRVLMMLVLLITFMAGIAVSNTISQVLGLAICALSFALAAFIVFRLNRVR